MKIAFYKGIRPGLAGAYSHGVRFITRSIYSHCEVILDDGMSASSSFSDGGVRFKEIDYDPDRWDIIDLPEANEAVVRKWFEDHEYAKYDLLGNAHFVLGFIGNSNGKWFCSEAIAAALGFPNPWRFDPGTLHAAILGMLEYNKRLQLKVEILSENRPIFI